MPAPTQSGSTLTATHGVHNAFKRQYAVQRPRGLPALASRRCEGSLHRRSGLRTVAHARTRTLNSSIADFQSMVRACCGLLGRA